MKNKKVWVNGCFDILHLGHIALLNEASSYGDVYVGIDSDKRVKFLKGEQRPFNNQEERKLMLEVIKFVKKVSVFNSEAELSEMIKQLRPDYLIVGDDYKTKCVIGSEWAREVIFFPKGDFYSTTNTINRIKTL